MNAEDIRAVEALAQRLADAIYYQTVDAIGTEGIVSTGLRHDDYDLLRRIAKEAKIANLEQELAALREKP